MASKELKKHVGAIHIKGSLSLLQRKVANVLLLNAYENLLKEDKHQIRVRDLAETAGFDSNNREFLKSSLKSLAEITVEWNVLDEDGQTEWGVSPLLAGAGIGKGVCTYSYGPFLREKLYSPEMYARINLSIQRRFRSGYALALYENCIRFRGVGTTGWIALEKWRELLGIEQYQYRMFKSFSQRVLKPAIKEVNGHSDVILSVEYQREKRKIVALKFDVKNNPQLALSFDQGDEVPETEVSPTSDDDSSGLCKRLLSFGLSETQAKDTLDKYDTERVIGNLDHVEAEFEAGKDIKNIPGYTLRAIEHDYRPREVEVEKVLGERKTEARQCQQERERKEKENRDRERQEATVRADRLDGIYNGFLPAVQEEIDYQVLEKLKEEVGQFAWLQYQKETAENKTIDDMSVVVKATFKNLRRELVEEMAMEMENNS